MLCVKNTDNSHRHVVCAEHRQFSPSCCVQNTKRTQTILTVILCVQNTVGRWCGHVHQRCRRLRVVTVAPAQSAVPAQSVTLLPVGQSVLTHHVFSGTRMDRRWHSEGQQTRRQQQTEVSVHSSYCLHRLWAVLSVLPSSFLSSLFSLSCLLPFCLLCSLCLFFFLSVFFVPSVFPSSLFSLSYLRTFCLLCSLCFSFFLSVFSGLSFLLPLSLLCSLLRPAFFLSVFVLSVFLPSFLSSLFSLSCLIRSCLLCSLYLAFFLSVFFVLPVFSSSFLSSLFSMSCLLPSCFLCSLCLAFFLPGLLCSPCLVFFSVFFLLRSAVLCTEEK